LLSSVQCSFFKVTFVWVLLLHSILHNWWWIKP
jgi:hypothetical protein